MLPCDGQSIRRCHEDHGRHPARVGGVGGRRRAAQAQRWEGSAADPVAGVAYGNHFGTLWFRCEAPGRVRVMVEAVDAAYPAGSRQVVVIRAGGRSFSLRGTVEINEMDEVSEITPLLNRAQATELFDVLARGKQATIAWPRSQNVVGLAGSAKALAGFARHCFG